MKKRLLALAFALVFALSGCSSAEDEKTTTSSSGSQQESTGGLSEEEEKMYQELKTRLLGGGERFPQLEEPEKGEELVVFHTTMGDIKIMLCPEEAPKACENFLTHCKEGYYDGIIFHRVIDGFMIQGGDPKGNGTGGESIWGGKFDDELSPDMYHFRGALAMANSGPNTNGSQFYIVQKDPVTAEYFGMVDSVIEQYGDKELLYNSQTGGMFRFNYSEKAREKYAELGGTVELDYGYTVFGMVLEGMDVVDAIAKVEKNASDKPLTDVVIEKVEIITY
ncbi:MAG: peptidylprolyl isomerase [Lachnospiraceae bacterium]|nr:peptidylprolyl isomerase [Lachnospiraceae bacterium]